MSYHKLIVFNKEKGNYDKLDFPERMFDVIDELISNEGITVDTTANKPLAKLENKQYSLLYKETMDRIEYDNSDKYFKENATPEQVIYFESHPDEYDSFLRNYLMYSLIFGKNNKNNQNIFSNSFDKHKHNEDTVREVERIRQIRAEEERAEAASRASSSGSSSYGGGGGYSGGGGVSGGW